MEKPSFSNSNPGRINQDYVYPDRVTIRSLVDRGVTNFRIPISWERLQPNLQNPPAEHELQNLDEVLQMVASEQARAIIDLHNYGRYRLETRKGPQTVIVDQSATDGQQVSRRALAEFWMQLAQRYSSHPAVLGYGIMNEPHDLGQTNWQQVSQEVVSHIRRVDRQKWLYVAGNDWSSSERFLMANGDRAWIDDPQQRTAYEAHCYFDRDGSGKYTSSYAAEARLDPNIELRPIERLASFANWCERNGVKGIIGEVGVPANDPNWNQLLQSFFAEIHQRQIQGFVWAAGDWWGEYPLSVQPRRNASQDSLSLNLIKRFS
ncbi:MAG: glycoside hydrolase family 5 protein [Planctomycetales bacterium]|nr:glycoside hydrolase family 5 protein [Planctomycetales bacterium]